LPPLAARWLAERIGAGSPVTALPEAEFALPAARGLPDLGVPVDSGDGVRLRHAAGQSFPDLMALRTGQGLRLPDGVVTPSSAAECCEVLRRAGKGGVKVVVRGGGTSVVGGVTVRGDEPTVVLSLAGLRGLVGVDRQSQLASFRAGTRGPQVEAALAPYGLRLGHEPQSFELSTVGGWVATRSAGARSTGVGKIEDLVAGIEVATPTGLWRLPPLPASAAGPELRRVLAGSEGRLGVLTEVTLRVRPMPPCEEGVTVSFPSWEEGVEACRTMLQSGCPVEVMRLSDAEESALALRLAHLPALVRKAGAWLARLRRFANPCVLLLGWAGSEEEVDWARRRAAAIWRAQRGVALGAFGWKSWLAQRFRHPYLRDALLDEGIGVDTLETAAPWGALATVYQAVGEALRGAGAALGVRVLVLCHLSHGYRDGASLYFTFLWPLAAGQEVAQWSAFKGATTEALMRCGAALSHHHGVGAMHAPWLAREIGAPGRELLAAATTALDSRRVLNPGVLLAGDRDGEHEGEEAHVSA
jgi:alkyldihydroxyacetonephosphate synthase